MSASVLWIIFEIALNGFDAAYLISLSSNGAGLKSWVKKWHVIAFWACLVAVYSIINYSTNFGLVSAFLFPVISISYVIYLDGEFQKRLFWIIFPFSVLYMLELILFNLFFLFNNVSVNVFLAHGIYRLILGFSCKIIDSVFWYYIIHNKKNLKISYALLQMFIVISFILFGTIVYILASDQIESSYKTLILKQLPVILSFSLCSCLSLFFTIKKEHRISEAIYHSEIIMIYKRMRLFRLETFQNLKKVWSLHPSIDSHQQYAEAFEQIGEQMQVDYDTGDDLVDIVLFAKAEEAFEQGIAIYLEGKLPPIHYLNPDDICLILDCLLSQSANQVSCIKDSDVAKIITIKLEGQKNELLINIENPTDGKLMLLSTNSIQYLIDRYKGKIAIKHEEYYFTTTVSLTYGSFLSQDRFAILKKRG